MKKLAFILALFLLTLAARAETRFQVERVDVQGNTVLSPGEVQEAVAPYQNRELTLPEVQQLAATLREKYEERGYFLTRVQVPTQDVTSGVVRLNVVEGRVGKLRIEGNEHYSEEFIRSWFTPLLEEKVARIETLHRSLLLLQDFMNLEAESVVEPGQEPGTADLVIKVQDSRPFEVGLRYDNFGNQFTGEHRMTLRPHAGNLFGGGETLLISAVFPFPAPSSRPFVLATFRSPVNRDGTQVGFSYANGAFQVGGDLTVLDIRGDAQIYQLFATHALHRAERSRSDLFFGLNSKSYENRILGFTSSQDEIRSLTMGYHAEWSGEKSRNLFSSTLTQGLGDFAGGTPNGSPLASRVGAGNGFTRLNLDYAHILSLGHPFLILRGSGQISSNPLVVGEQFSLGGPDSVRGYNQSEALGDYGYQLSAEVRLPLPDPDSPFQVAAFVDHGTEWLHRPQPGEAPERSLTGAGLGFRYSLGEATHFRLDLGFPLSPGVNSTDENPKVYGQIETRF